MRYSSLLCTLAHITRMIYLLQEVYKEGAGEWKENKECAWVSQDQHKTCSNN